MRYATLILAASFFLLAGCAGSKQTAGVSDTAAPMEANTVTVYTDMDGMEAYRRTAQMLQSRGYTLANTDETLRSISTDYRGIDQTYGVDDVFSKLSASVANSQRAAITLRGQYKTLENEDADTGQTIKKYGQGGSPARVSWKELHEAAEALGDSLSYQ